jgi:Type II secretion system (T2SS), protein M subtype b
MSYFTNLAKRKHLSAASCIVAYLSFIAFGLTFDRWLLPSENLDASLQSFDQLRAVSTSLKAKQTVNPEKQTYLNDDVLPAVADAVNTATMLTTLKTVAANHSIELTRTNELKPEAIVGVNWIGVSIGLNATEPALLNFVNEIEKLKPVLVIDKLVWQSAFQPDYDHQFPASHAVEMNILAVSLYNNTAAETAPTP